MRLSGNYFDRLLINVVPYTAIAGVLIYLSANNLKDSFLVFIITTLLFWLLDTSVLFFKFNNPGRLSFDTQLKYKVEILAPDEIEEIRPITDKRYRWSFEVVEFVLNNGSSFFVIDRPRFFFPSLLNDESKTTKLLVIKLPELERVVKRRRRL